MHTEFLADLKSHFSAEQVLGATHPEALRYTANVTGFERQIEGVVRPRTTAQVAHLIQTANQHRAALYPVSQGKNWGFGSRLPVRTGAFIVDLSEMNRVHEVNTELGYAVIEPGVTQRQLSRLLNDSSYYLDVTGSGQDTSIIGNSLDRGIAYNSLRAERLLNLEVVLGTGEVIQTGFGAHTNGPLAHLYRFGIGPQLDTLFFQSNLGIVTRATISLSPKLEGRTDFRIAFADRNLEKVFDIIRQLKKSDIISGIIRTGDYSRSFETMAPLLYEYFETQGRRKSHAEIERLYRKLNPQEWTSFGMLSGPRSIVRCKQKEMKAALQKVAEVDFFTDRKVGFAKRLLTLFKDHDRLAMLEVSEPLRQLVEGTPTDAAIKMVSWNKKTGQFPTNADASAEGFMLIVPIAPLSGQDARRLAKTTYEVCSAYEVIPGVTLNTITSTLLEGVISLKYSRQHRDHVERAEACANELYDRYGQLDYLPYRLNVNNMGRYVRPENPFWQTVSNLKTSLDPNRVISPGRYDLLN
jgi:4-cresol dehydrogenase (hydroxylating)